MPAGMGSERKLSLPCGSVGLRGTAEPHLERCSQGGWQSRDEAAVHKRHGCSCQSRGRGEHTGGSGQGRADVLVALWHRGKCHPVSRAGQRTGAVLRRGCPGAG